MNKEISLAAASAEGYALRTRKRIEISLIATSDLGLCPKNLQAFEKA